MVNTIDNSQERVNNVPLEVQKRVETLNLAGFYMNKLKFKPVTPQIPMGHNFNPELGRPEAYAPLAAEPRIPVSPEVAHYAAAQAINGNAESTETAVEPGSPTTNLDTDSIKAAISQIYDEAGK